MPRIAKEYKTHAKRSRRGKTKRFEEKTGKRRHTAKLGPSEYVWLTGKIDTGSNSVCVLALPEEKKGTEKRVVNGA